MANCQLDISDGDRSLVDFDDPYGLAPLAPDFTRGNSSWTCASSEIDTIEEDEEGMEGGEETDPESSEDENNDENSRVSFNEAGIRRTSTGRKLERQGTKHFSASAELQSSEDDYVASPATVATAVPAMEYRQLSNATGQQHAGQPDEVKSRNAPFRHRGLLLDCASDPHPPGHVVRHLPDAGRLPDAARYRTPDRLVDTGADEEERIFGRNGILKNASGHNEGKRTAKKSNSAPAEDSLTAPGRKGRLTQISQQYDLTGSGQLDPIEQAMRDRDVTGRGFLTNSEVHKIVQDQLKSQHYIHLYRKVAAGLVCLVAILALSNFGTSMASAILAKDTVADSESGTIQSKSSGEVMGFQSASHLFEMEGLEDEEFEERRRLVDAEMAEDPDHEDHLHRRLGRKKKNACGCSKMAYDHGKVKERDLAKMIDKCDKANTVNIKRTWKNGDKMDTTYDTVCKPGTVIVKKGKKKSNKHKTKEKVVNQQVTFKKMGRDGKDQSVTFNCQKGECYSAGETLHQRAGHPCLIQRDLAGASQCDEGLACYDPDDHSAEKGNGVCTLLRKYARRDQICDVSLGVNACEASYACYSRNGRNPAKIEVGTVRTGICGKVVRLAKLNEICDVSFGADACSAQYQCLGANGREIGRVGMGFCANRVSYVKFARRNAVCRIDYVLDACEAGYACYSRNGARVETGTVSTGVCQAVVRRAGPNEVCAVTYGADACASGLQCVDAKGRAIQSGWGVCARASGFALSGRTNIPGCFPDGAYQAADCSNSRSCASGTCLRSCLNGSDRWWCYLG